MNNKIKTFTICTYYLFYETFFNAIEKWNISCHIGKQGCYRHQQLQLQWMVSW